MVGTKGLGWVCAVLATVDNQTGGWSLTWQGAGNSHADFPNGQSILAGLRHADGAAHVTYSETAQGIDLKPFDAIVAVIGETPYAETMGDIMPSATLRHTDRYPEDLAVLQTVAGAHKPVVTVFVSGRPLYVNNLLNLSDAFVAAWLPGTEGAGVADVLFAAGSAAGRYNFRGALPAPWPGVPCPDSSSARATRWLFAPGYGLRYPGQREIGKLPTYPAVDTCADASVLLVFHTLAVPPFPLYLADETPQHRSHDVGPDLNTVIIRNSADRSHVDVPFGVRVSPPFSTAFADVEIVAGVASGCADLACASLDAP